MVARSSAKAKFRAMAHGICELLWIKIILDDLRIKWEGKMKLYQDNKLTINIVYNPLQHDQAKEIEVDQHFTKEKPDSGMICIPYDSTKRAALRCVDPRIGQSSISNDYMQAEDG